MRIATLLILLSLTASMSTVYAEEGFAVGEDVNAYCTEQAQMAGFEDASELSQYIQECIDSFAVPASE
ncbi:MAG: hypothetical protein LJE83_10675 [Gammaproteobacteria bacterium]|nr:hypothetical protein [Gammaproteobacteria bacterium]